MAEVEIIARVERRRKWTAEEKAALLAEVEADGGKVAVVARRHRISESVLYNWRAALKAAAGQVPVVAPFIPLGVFSGSSHRDTALLEQSQPPEPASPRPTRGSDGGVGGIEIVLPNGARVSVDAFVNEKALSRGTARDEGCDMIDLAPGTKVFLACRPIDLRAGFNGLAAKVQQVIERNPFDGSLFIFRGKRGDYFKAIYWDGTGLWLLAKRLEKGRFVWPPIVDGAMTLTPAQMAVLVEAMDWRRTITTEPPSRPMLV